uniref:Uncharacterized protein n=1 Tax=Oryza punctata TaxID=4537 RepID=A0A0E0L7Z0_ORYPU
MIACYMFLLLQLLYLPQHLLLPTGDLLRLLLRERRRQHARIKPGDKLLHGLIHALPLPPRGGARHGLGADLDGVRRHGGLVPEQLAVLGEQVEHVVVDVVHGHLLPHEPAPLLADAPRRRRVGVAPVDGDPWWTRTCGSG